MGAPCAGQRRAADAPLDSEAKLRRSLRLDSLGAARPIGSGYMVTFSSFEKIPGFDEEENLLECCDALGELSLW